MTSPGTVPTINALASGHVLTNAASHTIRGTFRVVHEMINQGTMIADQPGDALSLINLPMDNQGVLRATNGGVIYLNNDTIQTGAGVIELDNGLLDALPIGGGIATLTGNSIVGSNGGKMRLRDGNLEVENVTLDCDADILGQQFRSVGGNVNNGSMLLQLDGGNFGILQFDAPQTWNGTGEIVLNADSDSVLRYARINRTVPDDEVIHAATHTIRGTGEIFAALDNLGLITADVPSRTISLLSDDKKNKGTIRADQGRIQIFSIEIDQTAGAGSPGTMEAVNGGEFSFESATIEGGLIDVSGGSGVCASGINRFRSIEFDGTMDQITSGNEILDSITNNGLWVINTPRANSRVLDLGPGCVIGGTGTFRLNSPTNSSNAQIVTTTGQVESVTHGPAHTIEGEGGLTRLNMLNQGTLSPGFDGVIDPAIGVFELSLTSIMCEPTSTVVIEIEGAAATEHDRIVNIGAADTSFHCAGKLALSNINGYGGLAPGEFIDIVIAPLGVTGTFDTVTYPGVLNYEVLYLPDRVRVAYDCIADTNNDGSVTPTDFTAWVNAFNNNLPECDQNGDGACTPTDFTAWIANFNAGC